MLADSHIFIIGRNSVTTPCSPICYFSKVFLEAFLFNIFDNGNDDDNVDNLMISSVLMT
jgi:hypothetical protein